MDKLLEYVQKAKSNPAFQQPELRRVYDELLKKLQEQTERANGAEAEVEYLKEQQK